VDECGLDNYIYREYAYSLRGIPVAGEVSGRKYARTNVVAAKCCDNVVAPMIYDGTTDSKLFEYWFEHRFLKSIPRYSVAIVDNATFHRKDTLRKLAARFDCEVLFLPPYSPDINSPIENFWANLKRKLRNILHNYDNFDDALLDCF
jgi:transposase